jgi:hypothetical protein
MEALDEGDDMTTTTATHDAVETRHSWVPYAAIVAGAGFVLKFVLIVITEDKVDTAAAILYLGSAAVAIAAAIGTGLRARHGRRALVAVTLSFAVVAYLMGVGDLLKPAFEAFTDKQYVIDEGVVAVFGVILLALGARAKR